MTHGTLVTLAACVVALAACSKASQPANVAAAPAASAAAPAAPASAAPVNAGPAGPIGLADLPAPTAGQWKRVSSQNGAAGQSSTKCLTGKPIDPTADGPPCSKLTVVRTATGGFTIDGDCPNNGVSAKLHIAGEGDFKTSFTTDTTVNMSNAGGPPMTMSNHTVWTYVGACPAGG